jgi:DNA-binding winged helix-turn-helix (wHTH) protein/tetratricopeptide (TPR) repeat protein
MTDSNYQPYTSISQYFVGEWQLCVRTNQLYKQHGEQPIELEHRLVMLLLLFIENPQQVLDRDLILSRIWKGKVVNYDSLAVAVSHLRKALGDDSRAPRYIKTIPGVGYQFVATAGPIELDNKNTDEDPKTHLAIHQHKSKKTGRLIFSSVGILGIVLLISIWLYQSDKDEPADLSAEADKLSAQVSQLLMSNDPQQWLVAIQQSRHILRVHPQRAEAYIQIAEAKIRLLGDELNHNQHCEEVQALVNKAIELDAARAQSLMRKADLLFWCEKDYSQAEDFYRKAIEVDPKNDYVAIQYAQLLLARGRFAESLAQVEKARKLNPLNYSVPTVVWIYQMHGREDLALQELTRIQRTEPENRYLHISAYRVYRNANDHQKAYKHWRWLMKDGGFDEAELNIVDQEFSRSALKGVYKWLLAQKKTQDLGEYKPPLSWARYALAVGNKDDALLYLEQAFIAGQLPLLWVKVDPAYKSLVDNPGFQTLIKKYLDSTQ